MPGTASSGPMDTTGLDGAMITASASASASTTPGPGRATSAPANRTDRTATECPRRTKYSWKPTSSPAPSPSSRVTMVATGFSVIGSRVVSRPHAWVISAVTAARPAPSARRPVR